jgi:hypothetical protein
MRNEGSDLNPPIDTVCLSVGPCPSKLSLSTKHPTDSIHTHGFAIPISTPPRSAATQRETSLETTSSHPGQDVRGRTKDKLLYPSLPPVATLLSYPYSAEYRTPIKFPPHLSICESTRLTLLEHKDNSNPFGGTACNAPPSSQGR